MRKSVWRFRRKDATHQSSNNAIFPAIIALTGVLVGTFIGQRMNATTESDKTVRAKLEEGYFRTLTLTELATDLNMAAVGPVNSMNTAQRQGEYNATLIRYRDEMSKIVAISDLYELSLSSASKQLADCGHKFKVSAANHFLLSASVTGEVTVAGLDRSVPLSVSDIRQSQNDLVALRLECQDVADKLRMSIATAMKRHL